MINQRTCICINNIAMKTQVLVWDFQSQLIVYNSKVSWLFKFSNSADCLHFQSLLLALVCQNFYSLLHYLGYEKILGLRGDKKPITRSVSGRFLALKKHLVISFYHFLWTGQNLTKINHCVRTKIRIWLYLSSEQFDLCGSIQSKFP